MTLARPICTKLLVAAVLALSLGGVSCAHKKKGLTQDSLREKRVALAAINGAKEAKLQVEVAIVNEVISKGRFQIVDRTTVQNAMVAHPTEADWQRLGRALDADLILAVDMLEFETDTRSGYDAIEEEDSLLSHEHRTDRDKKWRKYYKVKAREGYVKSRIRFFDVAGNKIIYTGECDARSTFNSRDGDMPRAMKMLEDLTQQAVGTCFDQMPN